MATHPQHVRPVINLTELSGYNTFGDLLATVRKNGGVTQQMVAEAAPLHFIPKKVPIINARIYGDLERDRRAPAFNELVPLYQTLTQGCGIVFSAVERELYIFLAKKRIQRKKKQVEHISEEQWQQLAETLAHLDDTRRSPVQILEKEKIRTVQQTALPSRRQEAIARALRTDTSHLVERTEWIGLMKSYITMRPAKKLVIIQAISGAGKTLALTLLTQHLAHLPNGYLLPYKFSVSTAEDKTPDDQLDNFLATMLTDLDVAQTDEIKMRPLEERIEQVMAEIIAKSEQGTRVVILLDDGQEMLEPTGELSEGWQQFFHTFVQYGHAATIYLATREWPGWTGSQITHVQETELPRLSPEGGITIWKRFGFEDVPDDLLRQASNRCGGNQQMIELRAAHLQRPGFTFAWRRAGEITVRQVQQSENIARIERVLAEEAVFDLKTDINTREVLQQVISKRLSHQALGMLDILSISPLAMPFPLLDDICPRAELAFDELVRCSLIDRDLISARRAAAVPLVREARLQTLLQKQRKQTIEEQVLQLYEKWLHEHQEFCDDSEKGALVAEFIVLLMKQGNLLKAAELLINFGWLCALFGHLSRLQRMYNEMTRPYHWQTNPQNEAGKSLFRYQLAMLFGQKIDPWERDRSYRAIRENALSEQVSLQPHTEIYLTHYLMLPLIRAGRFTEAYQLLEETFERIAKSTTISPEEQASYLQSKSYLLGRWSEDKTTKQHPQEMDRLRTEVVEALTQGIALWKACRANALPLQENYINFKLARSLNDCAYYSRLIGRLEEAEEAITECIALKEGGATLPRSLAVSLSEYAQILMARGKLRQALLYSDRALQLIEQLLQKGDTSASSDKGMLLVERAHIYLQQARYDEAKRLFEEAIPLLISDTRKEYREEAEKQCEQLRSRLEISHRYQLDAAWYERYLVLASYDDLRWLAQAGPFEEEEQRLWDRLIDRRGEEEIWQQLSTIIVQSKKRELSRSLDEQRTPRILYPALDIHDIKSRIAGFEKLKDQVEGEERNAVVRRLYRDAITEHLYNLHLLEATYNQDTEGVQKYNELLYGKPTTAEMAIALGELFGMFMRAREHAEAGAFCQQLLKQLKEWNIHVEDFLPSGGQKVSSQMKSGIKELPKKMFSASAAQRFFEEIIHADYQFTEWQIIPAAERDSMALDLDLQRLYVPTGMQYSLRKILELIAEEIETHMYRSAVGRKSPLALLGSGTRGYLIADEGLAIHYTQQMMQAQGLGRKSYSWITTLTPGMVAGVLFPAMDFRTLYEFLYKAFLISNILAGGFQTRQEAEEAAKEAALSRAARTFRGVPDLTTSGVCNLKDRVYLQGYLGVSQKLESMDIKRLLVGSVGLDQLEDLEELHILEPAIPHRSLALDPHLVDRILALSD